MKNMNKSNKKNQETREQKTKDNDTPHQETDQTVNI